MRVRLLALIGCAMAVACGGDTPSSPTPPPPARTGAVEGIVNHESYLAGRITIPVGPLAGAEVTVTEGAGAGTSMTTGADGTYHFDLPPGPFRVRWSASAYEPRESDAGSVAAGTTTTVPTVTLRLLSNVPVPEWSISGTVVDGRGAPVAGAAIAVFSDFTVALAGGQTDATGHFRVASTRQHPNTLTITAGKVGYLSTASGFTCATAGACTPDVTLRILRIVREYLDAPSAMQVGDVAPVDIVEEHDDGSVTRGRATVLQSSNPAVLQVQPLVAPYEHVYVKAIAPGTAMLTYGANVRAPVSVYR